MTAPPSLSIIIPVLDEAVAIVTALEALAPLRARGVEIIVVDGGSADATTALARPLADFIIVSARGRAMQMNSGAAVARGDVFCSCMPTRGCRPTPIGWCAMGSHDRGAPGAASMSRSKALIRCFRSSRFS